MTLWPPSSSSSFLLVLLRPLLWQPERWRLWSVCPRLMPKPEWAKPSSWRTRRWPWSSSSSPTSKRSVLLPDACWRAERWCVSGVKSVKEAHIWGLLCSAGSGEREETLKKRERLWFRGRGGRVGRWAFTEDCEEEVDDPAVLWICQYTLMAAILLWLEFSNSTVCVLQGAAWLSGQRALQPVWLQRGAERPREWVELMWTSHQSTHTHQVSRPVSHPLFCFSSYKKVYKQCHNTVWYP